MSHTLMQSCLRLSSSLSSALHWMLKYLSSIIHVYLQTYFPLVYLADIAGRWHNDNHLYATALALLLVGLSCYRSLKLFFPWLHIWQEEENGPRPSSDNGADRNDEDLNNDESLSKSPEELQQIDISRGLSDAEALQRRRKYGKNVLWPGRNWPWTCLELSLRAGNMLSEIAMLIAATQQEWLVFLALLAPAALSNGVQLYQLSNLDDVGESLSWSQAMRAVVVRNGKIRDIKALELVPGDIIHISEGQTVPADIQVIRLGSSLSVDQSSITGESEAVFKDQGDMCYIGTGVLNGDAFCVVVETGYKTFVGRMLSLVKGAAAPSKRKDEDLNNVLGSIGSVLWAFTFATIFILYRTELITHNPDYLRVWVSCTVICIYANSRGSVTNMRAITAGAMSAQHAVVQSISSIDTLAGIDVLCSDASGTLMENRMSLLEPYCIDCDVEELILTACLSRPGETPDSDPIDNAILNSLRHYPQARNELVRYKFLDFEPFSMETKHAWALVESPEGEQITCIKGSPKSCLDIWLADNPTHHNKDQIVERFKEAARSIAASGARSLAIMRKRESGLWELLGLLPLGDPIRWNTASAIKDAHDLGFMVKVVTGSAASTAEVMIEKIGLGKEVLNITKFLEQHADDETKDKLLAAAIEKAACFSEAFPEDKVKLTQTLQNSGHLVAVTGDGTNDTPCLRLADYGIAVEGASESAQSAADVVLLKPGIHMIVAAIATTRRHFRLVETFLTHRAAVCISLIAMVFLYHRKFGDSLRPEYLFFITCIDDVMQTAFAELPGSEDAAIEKRPSTLGVRRLWVVGLPLSVVLVAITALVLGMIPSTEPDLGRKVIYLSTMVASHWSFMLVYTRGSLWSYSSLRYGLPTILGAEMIAALFCVFAWPRDERPTYFFTGSGERLAIGSLFSTLYQCWLMWTN